MTSTHIMEATDNEAWHAYILMNTGGEPRSIVKGCWGNGLEASRKLKNRLDPETELNQIGATLRASRQAEITDVIGKMGRRDQETRGNHRRCNAERGDQESHRNRDGAAGVGNTFEAERRQNTYGQMIWQVSTEPARKHVD